MVEGLMLTVSGAELRQLLEQRIEAHQQQVDRWTRERTRTPEEQTEDQPLLPEQICGNEAERHEWRAAVLRFLRDHLEPDEVYRVGEADLRFGELLPERPEWLDLEDWAVSRRPAIP